MLLLLIILVVAGIYLVKRSNNRKAAESGQDKATLRNAAAVMLPEGSPVLYAHWEERTHYGRIVRTTYYRYVLTYQGQTLFVAPLQVDKKTRVMQAGRPSGFSPDDLGKVIVHTKQKSGSTERVEVLLCNKQGESVLQFYVDAESLRKTRWYPVNIAQRQECEAFEGFITSLARRVDAENPGVDDLIDARGNESVGVIGAIFSLLGAFFTLFFAPIGLIACLVGLCFAVASKVKGAKGKAPLIIGILCMVWSVGLSWVFVSAYFV